MGVIITTRRTEIVRYPTKGSLAAPPADEAAAHTREAVPTYAAEGREIA